MENMPKKKTIKSLLCCTTACSALAMAGIGALNISNPKYEIFAAGVNSIPVTISNANFNSSTKNSYPYSPSSYTAYNQGLKVDSSNKDANISAGVINLSNEKYETRFSLAKRGSLDDYVFLGELTEDVTPNNIHQLVQAHKGKVFQIKTFDDLTLSDGSFSTKAGFLMKYASIYYVEGE